MGRAATLVLQLALFSGVAVADHCPEESIAKVEPETQLARISFERGGFPRVAQIYGPPGTSHEVSDSGYPPGSGEANYSWQVGLGRLEVFTMFYRDSGKRIESVVAVRTDGVASVPGFQTGRGLRLGDTFGHATKLYGPVYLSRSVNGPDLPGETRTFCFSDGTELGVGIDAKGKVTAIWLAPIGE